MDVPERPLLFFLIRPTLLTLAFIIQFHITSYLYNTCTYLSRRSAALEI